ncbi:hypothetical protein Hanom_Chr04g00323631 [Helianthus anomalus]
MAVEVEVVVVESDGGGGGCETSEEEVESVEQSYQIIFDSIVASNESYIFSPIYVVPSRLREVSANSFTPRVVSIGPLHKGQTNLKSMENMKKSYFVKLLREVGSPDQTLQNCMQMVMGSMERIRRYYFGMDLNVYTNDELALMMVIDGCFILRYINNLSISGNLYSDNKLRSRNIALDLVLLENQIPFFVLEYIHDLTVQKMQPQSNLTTMLKVILDHINPFEDPLKLENVGTDATHKHILGLLHTCYKPIFRDLPIISTVPIAHSAVELDRVGVKIKPNKRLTWPMEMKFKKKSKFWHKPTLKMPVVHVDNFFEVVLRNLIAYEQYSPVENYVTSYAMAMHMLVPTPADIAKLGKSGVVISYLGSNEKASNLISSICENVNLPDFYYMEPWKNIAQHCNSYWPRNLGVFKGTYIDTPWKVIALLAAIVVFFITVIQFFR